MVRTIISLDEEDKAWLERKAADEHVTMTELVRRAVRQMRLNSEMDQASLDPLLSETQGVWNRGDGLKYQQTIRGAWE